MIQILGLQKNAFRSLSLSWYTVCSIGVKLSPLASWKICFWKTDVAHYPMLLISSQCTYLGNIPESLRCSLQIQNISSDAWLENIVSNIATSWSSAVQA